METHTLFLRIELKFCVSQAKLYETKYFTKDSIQRFFFTNNYAMSTFKREFTKVCLNIYKVTEVNFRKNVAETL